MSLTINTNLASLNAQRQLNSSQTALSTSLQRLSSGLRINSARDDAAGLAISERFSTQIRGSQTAIRNANDGISMLQTAEGSLGNVTNQLQRIRELAVQAANATNSTSDREALQAEVDQLSAEVERIGTTAKFNGLFVFDQSRESRVGDADQLAVLDGLTGAGAWLENAESLVTQYFGLTADNVDMAIELTTFTDGAGGVAARVVSSAPVGNGVGGNITLQVDMADFVPPNLPDGGSAPYYNDRIIAHEMVHAVMAATTNWGDLQNHTWFIEGTAEFIQGADERVASLGGGYVAAIEGASLTFAGAGVNTDYAAGYAAVRFLHQVIKDNGGEGIEDVMAHISADPNNNTLDQAINLATDGTYTSAADFLAGFQGGDATAFLTAFDLTNSDTGAIGGLDVDGGAIRTAESVVPNIGTRGGTDVLTGFNEDFEEIVVASADSAVTSTFQIGANVGETLDTNFGSMNLDALGLTNALDLVNNAGQVMSSIDRALDYVNGERAKIGAQMSRFESTIANLQVTTENLTASRSRIMDADFAAETAALSRAQILQEAGTAMVAQANNTPYGVLALLQI